MERQKLQTARQLQTLCWKIEILLQKTEPRYGTADEIRRSDLKSTQIEMVTKDKEESERQHYILNYAVIKLDINIIKMRVIFDESAKSKKLTLSLKECLHRGPIILEDI